MPDGFEVGETVYDLLVANVGKILSYNPSNAHPFTVQWLDHSTGDHKFVYRKASELEKWSGY